MSTPRQIADRFTTAYNRHDWAQAAELYRPDVVLVSPGGGELLGREHAAEHHRGFLDAFPDAHVEVVRAHDAFDATIDEWIFQGTHTGPFALPTGATLPPTGRRVSVRGVDIMLHGSGGVARHHMYFDQVELLVQLGLAPAEQGA